jgi:phosphatidylinositol glycan class B
VRYDLADQGLPGDTANRGRAEVESTRRDLRRSLVFLAAVTLVTAYFSETFFHPDEHASVLAFLGYKLGWTTAAELPWEFGAHIRSWMQPFLYYLIARPLARVGMTDPFNVTLVLRMATGALSIASLAMFAVAVTRILATRDEREGYARSLLFYGFLPYLFVRTSSEALSCALFTAALALVLDGARSASARRLVSAGLLVGLAFECRYQTALLALGLYAWLAVVARVGWSRLAWLGAGSVVPILFAFPIDRWGYGNWYFPPLLYVRENLVNNTAARDYGSDPVYGYLYLLPVNLFAPIVLVLLVALFVAWARNPRHVLTWTMVPFVFVQSLVAHKEERFMFPLAVIATVLPVLAFAPSPGRRLVWFDRLWAYRRSIAAKAVALVTLGAMAFIAIYPFGFRPNIPMARYIYRHYRAGFVAYSYEAEPFASYPNYRPHPFLVLRLHDTNQIASLIRKGPIMLLTETPDLSDRPLPPGVTKQLLYSELPFAQVPEIAHKAASFKRSYESARACGMSFLPHLGWTTLYRIDRVPQAKRTQ